MEEAITQVAIQVPVAAGVLLFSAWLVRFLVTQLVTPRLDRLIRLLEDLMEDLGSRAK